jgi:hypothetical protein
LDNRKSEIIETEVLLRNARLWSSVVAHISVNPSHLAGKGYQEYVNHSTMEIYAAMKKSEMLSFAGKWMELENIILSEVSLAQKTKNCMFSLICRH